MPVYVAAELTENSIRYPGWRVAMASSACVFVSFTSLLVYTFGIFLKPLAAEFGWSRQAISAAFGLAALGIAACSPPLGLLFDRFPARRIIFPCLTVFGLAFASLSMLSHHLWHLYAVFIVLGIVGNGTAQLAYSRAISTWFHTRRGVAFAVLMTGGAVGAMVLPPVSQMLIHTAGWRNAFAILGAMVLAIGLPFALQVRECPNPACVPKDLADGASVREGLSSRIFWIIALVLFLSSIAQNGSIAHLSALLTDRGISAAHAALAASAMGGAALAGHLFPRQSGREPVCTSTRPDRLSSFRFFGHSRSSLAFEDGYRPGEHYTAFVRRSVISALRPIATDISSTV